MNQLHPFDGLLGSREGRRDMYLTPSKSQPHPVTVLREHHLRDYLVTFYSPAYGVLPAAIRPNRVSAMDLIAEKHRDLAGGNIHVTRYVFTDMAGGRGCVTFPIFPDDYHPNAQYTAKLGRQGVPRKH